MKAEDRRDRPSPDRRSDQPPRGVVPDHAGHHVEHLPTCGSDQEQDDHRQADDADGEADLDRSGEGVVDECPHADAETDDECDQADDADGRPGQASARDDDCEEAADGNDTEQHRHADDALHDVTS